MDEGWNMLRKHDPNGQWKYRKSLESSLEPYIYPKNIIYVYVMDK